jgi:Glyoxalase/Bleomycin resistance protein/Dioxygenase superfamily
MQPVHHVGYWVDDLGSALTRWSQDLGVGPFQVIEHVPFEEFVLVVDGQRDDDVVFDHSAAFAAWGPVVVELGQVHAIDDRLAAAYGVAPAAYGIAPGAYGIAPGAVSHVSWVVPDLEQESARLARLGCRPINTARSGPISVAWHDGGPLFPHPIELHQHNDVIAGMHDRLAALRCAAPTTADSHR